MMGDISGGQRDGRAGGAGRCQAVPGGAGRGRAGPGGAGLGGAGRGRAGPGGRQVGGRAVSPIHCVTHRSQYSTAKSTESWQTSLLKVPYCTYLSATLNNNYSPVVLDADWSTADCLL